MSKEEELRKQVADLGAQIAELQARLKALEPEPEFKRQPMPRWDPTARMQMPRNAADAMLAAVPDSLMRDVARDFGRGVSQPGSMIARRDGREPVVRGTGWQDAVPLRPPPEQELIGRLVDQQDRLDLVERARRFGVPVPAIKRRV